MPDDRATETNPVYVIESIPVPGESELSAKEIASEGIPTPSNLKLYPELGRGGMGRIHPATDRNLLRHVALKRLRKLPRPLSNLGPIGPEHASVGAGRDNLAGRMLALGMVEHPHDAERKILHRAKIHGHLPFAQ